MRRRPVGHNPHTASSWAKTPEEERKVEFRSLETGRQSDSSSPKTARAGRQRAMSKDSCSVNVRRCRRSCVLDGCGLADGWRYPLGHRAALAPVARGLGAQERSLAGLIAASVMKGRELGRSGRHRVSPTCRAGAHSVSAGSKRHELWQGLAARPADISRSQHVLSAAHLLTTGAGHALISGSDAGAPTFRQPQRFAPLGLSPPAEICAREPYRAAHRKCCHLPTNWQAGLAP